LVTSWAVPMENVTHQKAAPVSLQDIHLKMAILWRYWATRAWDGAQHSLSCKCQRQCAVMERSRSRVETSVWQWMGVLSGWKECHVCA
jgi:hypothetical protein